RWRFLGPCSGHGGRLNRLGRLGSSAAVLADLLLGGAGRRGNNLCGNLIGLIGRLNLLERLFHRLFRRLGRRFRLGRRPNPRVRRRIFGRWLGSVLWWVRLVFGWFHLYLSPSQMGGVEGTAGTLWVWL